ncbi:MAG: hypothetical protein WKF64_12945 [Ilumatobacteraceae bacterium]
MVAELNQRLGATFAQEFRVDFSGIDGLMARTTEIAERGDDGATVDDDEAIATEAEAIADRVGRVLPRELSFDDFAALLGPEIIEWGAGLVVELDQSDLEATPDERSALRLHLLAVLTSLSSCGVRLAAARDRLASGGRRVNAQSTCLTRTTSGTTCSLRESGISSKIVQLVAALWVMIEVL